MNQRLTRLIYHERQKDALCAVHCINNLLQGEYFSAVDLANIAQQLDNEEEKMYLQNGKDSDDYKQYMKRGRTNVSLSGDFSVQVVTEALSVYDIKLHWSYNDNPNTKEALENPTYVYITYILENKRHLYVIYRAIGL